MTGKNWDKYRNESESLPWWAFTSPRKYMVTICTRNREHYFGEIMNRQMNLSQAGILADVCWHELKNHWYNVNLGEFQVMPNHIHGVVEIPDPEIHSLSDIIGYYKNNVTSHANRLNLDFEWQSRFRDRIIRDERTLEHISNYIINNPRNWKEGGFYL